MNKTLLKYYPFLPLLLLCGFYSFKAVSFPIHDFANYYFSGKFLAEGHFNSATYFPYEFNKAIFDLGNRNIFASYAPNTPFLAVLFVPFSFLTVAKAKLLFNCISTLLFSFSLFRLFSFYKINPKLALLIPILFLVPIKNNILFGQVYFIVFFLLTEGWLAYEKEQWKTMALYWSLAILLKVFPVVFLAFLVFKKQWKPLLYLLVSFISLLGLSLLFTGIDIWFFYLKEVLPKASNGEIAVSFVDNYQSVFMFLKRLFVYDTIENPHPLFHAESWFTALVFGYKIGVVTIGYFISKKNTSIFYNAGYWILAIILLSPYGSTYTFILLVLPLLSLLKSEISNIKKTILCGLLLFINNLPLSFFIENEFPQSYLRLFLLLIFCALFVVYLFQKPQWLKAIALGTLAFGLSSFLKQPMSSKSQPFLAVSAPILIYDYKIENNQLIYWYWNEKGANEAVIPFKNKTYHTLEIKGCNLTFDKSHKLKPMLIDNKTIIFLSDQERGIGFYTLRVIKLK